MIVNNAPLTTSVLDANRRKIQAASLNQPLQRTSEVRRNHRSNEQAVIAALGESPSYSFVENGHRIVVRNLVGEKIKYETQSELFTGSFHLHESLLFFNYLVTLNNSGSGEPPTGSILDPRPENRPAETQTTPPPSVNNIEHVKPLIPVETGEDSVKRLRIEGPNINLNFLETAATGENRL